MVFLSSSKLVSLLQFARNAKSMRGASKAEEVFQPGEVVTDSGVYSVLHDGHRERHPATIFRGSRFPSCARCGNAVRFVLLRPAALISDDLDFQEPLSGKDDESR